MDSIFQEYLDEEVNSVRANWNLDQIVLAVKRKWAEVDLSGNIHDVTVNLKSQTVHISGIMEEDPETTIPLKEFEEIMHSRLDFKYNPPQYPDAHCEVGDNLIAIQDLLDGDGQSYVKKGEEFVVQTVAEYGFDIIHHSLREPVVRVLFSDLEKCFRMKNYP